MKKYKLLKDIPTQAGFIKAGEILIQEPFDCYAFPGHFSWTCNSEFIQNTPEFFEEVTRWKPEMNEEYFAIISNGTV